MHCAAAHCLFLLSDDINQFVFVKIVQKLKCVATAYKNSLKCISMMHLLIKMVISGGPELLKQLVRDSQLRVHCSA